MAHTQREYCIYKLTDYLNKGIADESTVVTYNIDGSKFNDIKVDATFTNDLILVNNSIVYGFGCAARNASVGCFYKINLSDDNCTPQNLNFDYSKLNLSSLSNIHDLIYQDGYIYMLWNQQGTSSYNTMVSQGGILRYSLSTRTYNLIGFDTNKVFSDGFLAACSYDGEPVYSTNTDTLHTETFTQAFSIQGPYENENSHFAGPEQFVAIKPKKLVISDSGIAMYTNKDGLLAQKKVNRIIEIDLETLSMQNAKITDVDFKIDYSYANVSFSGISKPVNCTSGQYVTKSNGVSTDINSGDRNFYPYIIEE